MSEAAATGADDPRVDPPLLADEVTTLRSFLDFHRETLRLKCAGLSQAQLAERHPPSGLTLAGLMNHLAMVDYHWFVVVLTGADMRAPFAGVDWDTDPDWEFDTAVDHTPAELLGLFDACVAASDEALDRALTTGGLDQLSARTGRRETTPYSLRYILVHMIEEYCRHNGHADLIRESIDGSTGE